jgi:hypothetical protein
MDKYIRIGNCCLTFSVDISRSKDSGVILWAHLTMGLASTLILERLPTLKRRDYLK